MGVTQDERPSADSVRAGRRIAAREPVTAVFSRRAKPGTEAEVERWAHNVITVASHFPGHLGATVLHEDGTRDYHIVYTFSDRQLLQNWLDSDTRHHFLARVDQLTETHDEVQQATGLETWFKLPRTPTMKPPPRWKMWLVSLLAIYPLVMAFQKWLLPVIKDWPLPLRALIFPLILLTLMTWIVMPLVTRAIRAWLYRQQI
jgi:antibiotic biosynthesis monooxygenase (ABM) superfamily enzyme